MPESKVTPKVTIIMATFNRLHYIEESLESIRVQSYKNWECIIIDDGSKDGTLNFLGTYVQKDPRIKFYKRSEDFAKGLPGCRNMGLEKATGDYVVFFDDDDIVHPDNLQICVEELLKSQMDYCRYLRNTFSGNFSISFDRTKDYEVSYLNSSNLESIIIGEIPFNSCQVVWKKECFKNNLFNETLMYAEEWECYSRILAGGVRGVNIRKTLFYGRKHPNSNTGEFWTNNPLRRESKKRAANLMVNHLATKNKLSLTLRKFFIRIGFDIKDLTLIRNVLKKTGTNVFTIQLYQVAYNIYPVLQPLLKIKGKIIKG